jgi:hypothetical protein
MQTCPDQFHDMFAGLSEQKNNQSLVLALPSGDRRLKIGVCKGGASGYNAGGFGVLNTAG